MDLITYKDLHAVKKKDLIKWLEHCRVYLPPISREEFMREVKILRLREDRDQLLHEDYILSNKIEAARGNTERIKELLQESRKLDEKLERKEQQLRSLLKGGYL